MITQEIHVVYQYSNKLDDLQKVSYTGQVMKSGTKKPAERNGFLRIATAISKRIESGEFLAGTLLPTEKQLQDEYGISRTTVRRTVTRLIEAGWAKSIPHRGVMVMGGIGPITSSTIAFIYGITYVQRVLASRFTELFAKHEMTLDSINGFTADQGSAPLSAAIDGDYAAAIIWNTVGFLDPELVRILASKMPVVSLVHVVPDGRIDRVGFDEFQASYEATMHLVCQGCRRIAITGMLDMLQTSHDRFSGYLKALLDSGMEPQVSDFVFSQTSGEERQDASALLARLNDHDHPDGLLIINDICANVAVQACMRASLRVPDDIKIVALGDEIDISIDGIGLTTVAYDWDAMANATVEALLDRIKNSIRPARVNFAPHRLIVRGLCGAPPEEWTEEPDLLSGFHGNAPFPRFQYRFSSSWTVQQTFPRH